ncbi:hypothetical protein J7F03_34210 [Streptomyces sp. ISL-43]|uniref:hypothetical protein n=1 Tax=Streptomyces sp. ISL-43 TaxID=2819183 RepID=UPI001BE611DF|nr:hypothetical protein [Streptomyces sp. ISL-43]MBT2452026.1 hypothetical protein [Streptomyces sp. ISL-43]
MVIPPSGEGSTLPVRKRRRPARLRREAADEERREEETGNYGGRVREALGGAERMYAEDDKAFAEGRPEPDRPKLLTAIGEETGVSLLPPAELRCVRERYSDKAKEHKEGKAALTVARDEFVKAAGDWVSGEDSK